MQALCETLGVSVRGVLVAESCVKTDGYDYVLCSESIVLKLENKKKHPLSEW